MITIKLLEICGGIASMLIIITLLSDLMNIRKIFFEPKPGEKDILDL